MAGVTAEQVIAAAEAIAAQGDRPSVRSIRDRLETGSFNTIQRYLSEWRETRPQITQAAYELPAELANAFGKELRRGAESATAELRAELSEAHAETKERAKDGESLEIQLSELTETVETLAHERDTALAEVKATAGEIARLADELNRERDSNRGQQQELATATVKIEVLEEQILELKGDLLGVRGELVKANNGRQQAEKGTDKAVAAQALEAHKAQEAKESETRSADLLTAQINDLKSEVALARTDAKEARAEAREARLETKSAHDATAKEVEAWRDTVALEHKRNAELQSERDGLAERLAVLEAPEKEQDNG